MRTSRIPMMNRLAVAAVAAIAFPAFCADDAWFMKQLTLTDGNPDYYVVPRTDAQPSQAQPLSAADRAFLANLALGEGFVTQPWAALSDEETKLAER